MNIYLVLYTLQLATVVVIASVLGVYALRQQRVTGSRVFIGLMIAASVWALGDIMEVWTDDLTVKKLWTDLRVVATYLTPGLWLALALSYTHHPYWLKWRYLAVVYLLPAAGIILILTERWHNVLYSGVSVVEHRGMEFIRYQHNPMFYIFILYLYLMIVAALILFVIAIRQTPRGLRGQLYALIIALAIPAAAGFRPVLGIPTYVLPTSTMFIPAGMLVLWAMYRHRLFDLVPVARSRVFQNLADAIIVLDADLNIVDVNQAAKNVLNSQFRLYRDQYAGIAISRFLDLPAIAVSEPGMFELQLNDEHTQECYECHVTPIEVRSMGERGFVLTLRNITQRKAMEQALQRSEERYRDVVENQTELVCRYQSDMTITFVNAAYCRYFGYTRTQLIGKKITDLLPETEHTAITARYKEICTGGAKPTYEHRNVLPDGSVRWQLWVDSVIKDEHGRVVEVQTVGRDITELKEAEQALQRSEERLRATIKAIPDLMFRMRADGTYLDVHAPYAELLAAPAEYIIDRNIKDILPADVAALSMRYLDQVVTTGNPCQFEYDLTLDGSTITFEASMVLLHNNEVLTVVRDITSRKTAQNQAFEIALEKERAVVLAQFIQNAAHEFRTPLATINTSAYLMTRVQDLEKRKEYATQIEKQVLRTTRLVDMLLRYTRMQNLIRPECREVNVSELVSTLFNRMIYSDAQHQFQVEISEEPLLVYGCSAYLQDAFEQLIENAQQYTAANGTITGRVHHQDKQVIVEIQDTGVGIAPDVLPRVFDTFWRQDDARSTPGFGLGLSIVRRVAELHSGSVQVESTEGKGSCFRLILPRHINLNST